MAFNVYADLLMVPLKACRGGRDLGDVLPKAGGVDRDLEGCGVGGIASRSRFAGICGSRHVKQVGIWRGVGWKARG